MRGLCVSMAPRPRLMLPCFVLADDNVAVPAPAAKQENGHENVKRQRRWTGEIKRKILAATTLRPPIWAVRVEPCDDDDDDVDVEKQRRAQAPPPEPTKVPEQQQATTTRREKGAPAVLQSDRSPSNDGGAPEAVAVAVAVAVDGRRKKKGLRVRFDLPPEEEMSAGAPPVQVQPPRFPIPTGVQGEPPESFARSGAADMTAFLISVVIADEKSRGVDDSARTRVERDLVACWTERKAACSRRLSYLRDYCPFQREEEKAAEEEQEEDDAVSEPETTTRPVKTGLPFDSPESEAEFVNAIRSRYLHNKLKDDFVAIEQQSLMAAGEGNITIVHLSSSNN